MIATNILLLLKNHHIFHRADTICNNAVVFRTKKMFNVENDTHNINLIFLRVIHRSNDAVYLRKPTEPSAFNFPQTRIC